MIGQKGMCAVAAGLPTAREKNAVEACSGRRREGDGTRVLRVQAIGTRGGVAVVKIVTPNGTARHHHFVTFHNSSGEVACSR